VEFFVVHLSPADLAFRIRESEIIIEKIKRASDFNPYYMILGDFNSHSPFDGDFDKLHPKQLARTREGDLKNDKHENLLDGEYDYGVISSFLSVPLIDVCQKYVAAENRFTFPAPALVGIWQTANEVKENKHRIDFILVSPQLAKRSVDAGVHNGSDTGPLADHYPVSASFNIRYVPAIISKSRSTAKTEVLY
jgi:exodeoxyribonuclease III